MCSVRTANFLLFKNVQFSRAACQIVSYGKYFQRHLKCKSKPFGNESISRTQIYEWKKRYKDGRTAIENGSRSGRLSTAKDDKHVAKVVK
jgi:hypothetical protein